MHGGHNIHLPPHHMRFACVVFFQGPYLANMVSAAALAAITAVATSLAAHGSLPPARQLGGAPPAPALPVSSIAQELVTGSVNTTTGDSYGLIVRVQNE